MSADISATMQQELLPSNHHHHHHQAHHQQSSPESSPQHAWPMVPVLQTLTVLSEGEEELMQQKMGMESHNINNNNNHTPGATNGGGAIYTPTTPSMKLEFGNSCSPPYDLSISHQSLPSPNENTSRTSTATSGPKRKVGRPITSAKTLNRSFPAVAEIREKLEAGECYVRPRASNSSSDVWALFMEVAYNDTHFFTGIVQCKTCGFLTRYHGQITGTSHMRRHACFSIMFPNSAPVRKSKNANATNGNVAKLVLLNGAANMDADSTTSKGALASALKRMKKNDNKTMNFTNVGGNPVLVPNRIVPLHPSLLSQYQQHLNNLSNDLTVTNPVTIQPVVAQQPKKKFRNLQHSERSLMASSSSASSKLSSQALNSSMASLLSNAVAAAASMNHQQQQQQQQSQSQPQQYTNGHASSPPRSSSSSASSPLPLPSVSGPNNARLNSAKQELREKIVQFCCTELVPLSLVRSDSLHSMLQAHVRVCAAQLQPFLYQQQQQQQHPASLATNMAMVTSFFNHLSHQLPDEQQLQSNLELVYCQVRDRLKGDLHRSLTMSPGSALTCDSPDRGVCVMSVYYVDVDWKLNQAVLATSTTASLDGDINRFVSTTLQTYQLAERDRLAKFTFVSHGSGFGNLSQCLRSMGHIIDRVVTQAIEVYDQHGAFGKLVAICLAVCKKLNLDDNLIIVDNWCAKHDLLKLILKHRDYIDHEELDFELIAELVELFESFRTASHELRKCADHPTLCHVLLYYHKLKKVLSTTLPAPSSPSASPIKLVKKNRSDAASSSIDSTGACSDSDKEKDLDEEEEKMVTTKEEAGMQISREDDKDVASKVSLEEVKKCLLESLQEHYKVEPLHRVATFLWPNFRFLKMLSTNEQKEVHAEVRRLLQVHCHEIDGNKTREGDRKKERREENANNDDDDKVKRASSNFDEWEVVQDEPDADQDEVDKYLSMQLSSASEANILIWWRQHSPEFPKLGHLVKWILSIPASVVTPQRFESLALNCNEMDDHALFLHCNLPNEKLSSNLRAKTSKPKANNRKANATSNITSSSSQFNSSS